MSQKHLRSVNRAARAASARLGPADEPLIELMRELARQMDRAGPDASTRLSSTYLSALKDFRRITSGAGAGSSSGTVTALRRVAGPQA